MKFDFSKLNTKTKALLSFLLFNVSIAQWQQARDLMIAHVFPLLSAHPKWSAWILSAIAALIALHKPGVQTMLHDMLDPAKPDVPAVPGAKLDNVEVVQPVTDQGVPSTNAPNQ
jgi:hypothetical protein